MTGEKTILIIRGEIRRYRSMANLCGTLGNKTLEKDYRDIEEALLEALKAYEICKRYQDGSDTLWPGET